MINIRNEFRISLSMGCLGGIVVPLLFEEELGKFSAVFLALGFLCLLCAFAVRYVKGIRAAFGIGVFLLAVGVVGFVILH